MKAPDHEIVNYDRYGCAKTSTKRFWLVSNVKDAYGKNICEGDIVYVYGENFKYKVEFNGNAFIMADSIGENNGYLADFEDYKMEIVGHVAEGDSL